MSLITQCPACATMFRVVPDQLRISEGWVRCGQCDEVFDANAHLQSLEPAAEAAPAPPPTPIPAAVAAPDTASPDTGAQRDSGLEAYDWGGIDSGFMPSRPVEPEEQALEPVVHADPAAVNEAEEAMPVMPESEYQLESDSFLSQNPHDLSVAEGAMAEQYAAAAAPEVLAPDDALVADTPLSFMPPVAERPTRWRRFLGTPMLLAVSVLFALALVLQILQQERNHLAAAYPAARPALQVVCAVLGCQIGAPRQIEAIAIESSAFNGVRPGIYQLRVTLKNGATLALETPALELILTDMQDRSLLRRVIRADEYASLQPVLASGAEWSLSVPMAVNTTAVLEKIAGYKLLAFYP